MADYGSVRHPLYSIGEGVGREKEERLRKQGLLKKKKRKEPMPSPPPTPPPGQTPVDSIWAPQQMPGVSDVELTPSNKNIMDKIWGNSQQRKKKISGI